MERENIVVPFKNIDDLKKKARLAKDLDAVLGGIDMAFDGKGTLKIPDESHKEDLEKAHKVVADYKDTMVSKSFQPEDLDSVARVLSQVKIGLSEYLSEEQFVEIFGTDSLT